MKKIKPLHLIIAGILLVVSPPFLFHYRMSGRIWADYLSLAWLLLFAVFLIICAMKLFSFLKRIQLKQDT